MTKKRGKKADRTEDQERQEQELATIATTSLEAVKLLVDKVLQQDIHLLWKEQKIDEDFVK